MEIAKTNSSRIPSFGNLFARVTAVTRGKSAVSQGMVMALSTVASRALVIVGMPLLTRLFSPDAFGVYSLFIACTSIGTVAVSWRYEMAIAISSNKSEAANLAALSLLLLIAHCCLIWAMIVMFGANLAAHWELESLLPCLKLLPLALFCSGSISILTNWATRRKALGGVAVSNAALSLGTVIAQLFAGLAAMGAWGLSLGDVGGRGFAAALLGSTQRREARTAFKRVTLRRMQAVMRRHKRYPMFYLGGSLLNSLSVFVPLAFLAPVYGSAVAGAFALSLRVSSLPVLLLGQAVSQVFLSRARQCVESDTIALNTKKLLTTLSKIAIPYTFLLVVAAPELFSIAFGESWRDAGVYTRFLAPWLLMVFLASPLSSLALLHNQHGNEFRFQAILLAGRIASMSVCFITSKPLIPICVFGTVGALLWFTRICWLLKLSGNSLWDCYLAITPTLRFAVLMVCPLIAGKLFHANHEFIFASSVVLALLTGAWFLRGEGATLLKAANS